MPPRRRFQIPWWLLLALFPAVLIGLNEIRIGGRERVNIIGAGPVHILSSEDAPEGTRFVVKTRAEERMTETAKRIRSSFQAGSPILVFGLDTSRVRDEETVTEAKKIVSKLVRGANGRAIVSVVVGFSPPPKASSEDSHRAYRELATWWRTELCRERSRQICVDVAPFAGKPDEAREAIVSAVRNGLGQLESYRASTQVGR